MINSFIFPISFEELNHRLHHCALPQEIGKKTGFKVFETKDPSTLEIFIKAISYPIESYVDINKHNLKVFIEEVDHLFPPSLRQEKDKKALGDFWKMICQKLNPSPLQAPISTPSINKKLEDEEGMIDMMTISADEAVDVLAKIFKFTPIERLEQILVTKEAYTEREKALVLQYTLNFLVLEEDLRESMDLFADSGCQMQELAQKIREGNCQIIHLSETSEALIFELPQQFEETEELAFWLSFSSFFDLCKDNNKIYVCIKPIEKWQAFSKELVKKLTLLKMQTKNDKIHFIIDKFFYCLEYMHIQMALARQSETLRGFFVKINSSFLFTHDNLEDLEKLTTPLEYCATAFLNRLHQAVRNNLRRIPTEHFSNLKKIMSFWNHQRDQQIQLYKIAYARLDRIIQSEADRKARSELLQFKKNLVGKDKSTLPECLDVQSFPLSLAASNYQAEDPAQMQSKQSQLSTVSHASSRKKVKSKQKNSRSSSLENLPSSMSSLPTENQDSPPNKSPSSPHLTSSLFPSNKIEVLNALSSESVVLPGKPFPYLFNERVERWHRHPFGASLPDNEFPEYSLQTVEHQKLMHVFHALHPMVDRFMSLGIQDTWQNTWGEYDDRFVIPAQISYQGKKHRGFIAYAIDPRTQTCYHKYFCKRVSDLEMLSDVIKGRFDDHDFPSLEQTARATHTRPPAPLKAMTAKVVINPIFGSVTIEDSALDLCIELFKMESHMSIKRQEEQLPDTFDQSIDGLGRSLKQL